VAYGVTASGGTSGPLTVVRDNLTYNNALGAYRPTYGSNVLFTVQSSFTGNPMYVDRTAKDFHLQTGSPALGKADPAYTPPYDKTGIARTLFSAGGAVMKPALGAFN